jgi:hypothetical protein
LFVVVVAVNATQMKQNRTLIQNNAEHQAKELEQTGITANKCATKQVSTQAGGGSAAVLVVLVVATRLVRNNEEHNNSAHTHTHTATNQQANTKALKHILINIT